MVQIEAKQPLVDPPKKSELPGKRLNQQRDSQEKVVAIGPASKYQPRMVKKRK